MFILKNVSKVDKIDRWKDVRKWKLFPLHPMIRHTLHIPPFVPRAEPIYEGMMVKGGGLFAIWVFSSLPSALDLSNEYARTVQRTHIILQVGLESACCRLSKTYTKPSTGSTSASLRYFLAAITEQLL